MYHNNGREEGGKHERKRRGKHEREMERNKIWQRG